LRSRASLAIAVDGVLLVAASVLTRDSLHRLDWLDALLVLAIALTSVRAVVRSSRSHGTPSAVTPARVSRTAHIRDTGGRALLVVVAGLIAVRPSVAALVAGVFSSPMPRSSLGPIGPRRGMASASSSPTGLRGFRFGARRSERTHPTSDTSS
jgi:hypothetical protein